ncbi:MAG: MurR/RpiR family transcriptional regulator [Anaerolineae bacterium]|jgi:DNA-binding MurR/RpiR family transcriptional regulator
MFRTRIRENFDRLTPSFKKLGEFLLDNYFDAAFMTASQLANRLDIDPATVVRFSQRLGYRGYPELLADVRTAVRDELDAVYKTDVKEGTPHDAVLKLIDAERTNLERMETQLKPEALKGFVEALESAKRIFVVSQWAGLHLARMFADLLHSAGMEATAVDAAATSAMTALHALGEGDLVLSVALADVGPDMGTVLKFARERGAATYAVTTWASSSAARSAEVLFVAPGRTPTTFPSFAMLSFFLSTIFQTLLARRSETVEKVAGSMKTAHQRMAEIRARVDLSGHADELWE